MYAIVGIARFTLLEAFRNRLIWLFLVLLLIGVIMAEFTGDVAITESVAVKTSLLSAALRLFSVFVISLYVTTSMIREINEKGLELTLSLPISRANYYFGKLIGFSLIALFMALAVGLALSIYAPLYPVAVWSLSLFCELLIMSALSLLCVYTFSQVTIAVTAITGFYFLCRSIDAIILMGKGTLIDLTSWYMKFITKAVDALAYVLPDLYRFSPSEWLIYSDTTGTGLVSILLQTIIYTILLSAAGLFDLYRKNF